jgi:capsular polysaccharide transport system permease protein
MNVTTGEQSGPARHPTQAAARQATAIQNWTTAFRNWATVMTFLMAQHFGFRARAGRLGTLLMLAEPFILIGIFYLIRGVIRIFIVQYGESLFLFLASGLFPFYLFMRTALFVRQSQLKRGPRLPRITSLDVFMATTAMNTLIWLLAIVAVFIGMWAYGIERARPASISDCAIALFLLVMVGAGFGLINSTIARYFPAWTILVGFTMRGMIFFSGVIHIADLYRAGLREWLAWNPVLHGVTWFRVGVYGTYPDLVLDRTFLVKCAIVFVFIGIVADRATLRRESS